MSKPYFRRILLAHLLVGEGLHNLRFGVFPHQAQEPLAQHHLVDLDCFAYLVEADHI